MSDFPTFDKIPRLNRTYVITEKIDGTNGLIEVRGPFESENSNDGVYADRSSDGVMEVVRGGQWYSVRAGSRSRWLTDNSDNFGFHKWAYAHAVELTRLGTGLHYGEWYGKGIQRGYGLNEKRFMLFNSERWADPEVRPKCCEVATWLHMSTYGLSDAVAESIQWLKKNGSKHVPGFMRREGVVVYHTAARQYFKVLCEGDDVPKGVAA